MEILTHPNSDFGVGMSFALDVSLLPRTDESSPTDGQDYLCTRIVPWLNNFSRKTMLLKWKNI
jgi:hypothetical protein